MKNHLIKTTAGLFFLLLSFTLEAQLVADFSITNGQGCAPLKVSFADAASGVSPSAVYLWDLGNGNTSALKNPSAVYYTEGTFTIRLTVKDGNQTSVKTKSITVYKKPSPQFTFSTVKGCSPLQVNFNSTSSPGDGLIINYLWDFGDGSTSQPGSTSINHTYETAQKATVSLTVVNQHGCYSTITKDNIIDVLPPLIADFTVDQTILCRLSDEVQFTNKSAGPGTLSYLWDFGDGNTSTLKDPKHIYTQKGIYTIKLTVTNTDGCTSVKTLQNYVNVASFKADFNFEESQVCFGTDVRLLPLSTPTPVTTQWHMGDGTSFNYNFSFRYNYSDTGKYNVKLVNTFGNNCRDSITKTIRIKPTPVLNGFLDTVMGKCGAPVEVRLTDTSKSTVTREWWFNYGTNVSQFLGTAQMQSTNVTINNAPVAGLIVTNTEGCKAYAYKQVFIIPPPVSIVNTYSSAGQYVLEACDSITLKFRIDAPQDPVVSYQWFFSDNTTSTELTPQHTFSTPGYHNVRLEYTTANGCKGTAYITNIRVTQKTKNDFSSISGTKICGNSVVLFRSTPVGNSPPSQYWYINGQYAGSSSYNSFQYQFQNPGKYTIMMLTFYGRCVDTVIKTDYIEVTPPIVKIDKALNTCDGNRTAVRFFDASKDVTSWSWNFGDGNTRTYTSFLPEITHNYAGTGYYKVILSATNGACALKDSIFVDVYKKQSPVLTAPAIAICPDQPLTVTLSNIDQVQNPFIWASAFLEKIEYEDGTEFRGTINPNLFNSILHPIPISLTLSNFAAGKKQLRFITRNSSYYCADTSNYITLKINGASAGFEIVTDNQCFKIPVVLRDTSKAAGTSPIVSWEWNFGDGVIETRTQGGAVTHLYENPGSYTVTLKVKDAAGCISSFASYSGNVVVKGPKAAFSVSNPNVPLNSAIYFFNNTNNWATSNNIQYKWNFGNLASSTDAYPFYTYTVAGTYTVTLTATDLLSGCTSTATKIITVQNFNSAFSVNTSFATNTNCPPVIARFSNTSVGYMSVRWDFGDGTTAGNVNYPSHVYTKPGKYIVRLFVYGNNGLQGTYFDSVIVKGQQAALNFDPKQACSSQQVRFKASSTGIADFLWDFGDGTLFTSTDSNATHIYKAPGLYTPILVGGNEDGCSVAFPAAEKIIIDSLSAKITGIPAVACNEANIQFNADVYSIGAANNPGFLSYKWTFGTGNPADTSVISNPVFKYRSPGSYIVSLQVRSKSGCIKEVIEKVVVNQSAKASVSALDSVCTGQSVLFTGRASVTNGVQWNWDFKNGQKAAIQNPPALVFSQAGNYPVTLIVTNNGCNDTAMHLLTVSPLPVVQLSASSLKMCAGTSVRLTASGGDFYEWSPGIGLSNSSASSPMASPAVTTTYKVKVTSKAGCAKTDSLTLRVIQPFKLTTQKKYTICEGDKVDLSVTGASTYKWIGNTQGLNTTGSGTVIARPLANITYTVVGYDNEGCFSDTAAISFTVNKRPFVNAGADTAILPGTPYQFTTTASADITKWEWSPKDFLSCLQCASPISTTTQTIQYIVKVTNVQGCAAYDTVTLRVLCGGSKVFIPNSFTPNNDGVNDVFMIHGNGASFIKLFAIFDRWGNKVFERKDISIDNPSAGWNGYYNGLPAPVGAYTYSAKLLCDATGEVFEHKGTVLVLR
ncbi:MAG: PKD domain-containing protein [Chitinophagaceae bacterium]|nr:PKD domain-containing protein [Chitinophagaceae bacterium]